MEATPNPPPVLPETPAEPRSRTPVILAAFIIVVGCFLAQAYLRVRDSSKLKAMIPRQLAAAVDQFQMEFPDRIFISYDELVGPDRYLKAYSIWDGEDPRVQFPLRQGWSTPLSVRLPDGSTVERYEVLAAIGRSGLIVTYPRPQDDASYNHDRVYHLDCGVSYRGERVVNLPPDPAGREGRDQDGVHIYSTYNGGRYEITYRGGVPDGPFRAFYDNGAPWGEATYLHGRVIEAWLITRHGRRFNELHDGPAASAALEEEFRADMTELTRRGREKLAARDFRGALADFTAVQERCPYDSAPHLDLADAQFALGNIGGALQECEIARTRAFSDMERDLVQRKLAELQHRAKPR